MKYEIITEDQITQSYFCIIEQIDYFKLCKKLGIIPLRERAGRMKRSSIERNIYIIEYMLKRGYVSPNTSVSLSKLASELNISSSNLYTYVFDSFVSPGVLGAIKTHDKLIYVDPNLALEYTSFMKKQLGV